MVSVSGTGFDDNDGTSRRQRSSSASPICFEYTDDDGENHRKRLDPSKDPSHPGWLTEVERDAREFDAALPKLRLPGTGDRLPDCGDDMPVVFCSDCMGSEWAGRTCRRSACPRCNESWAFNGAKTDASKAEALRRKRNVVQNSNRNKQHHLVFSAPRSLRFDSKEPLKRGKELVKALAGKIDLDAGTIYYHPWRIVEAYRGDVAGHASGSGDMTWADILSKIENDNGWSWDAIKHEFLVFAPHFHVIGTSRFVQGGATTDEISQKTGFVTHRITKEDSKVSIYDQGDLCRATAYCRTHTGLAWDVDNENFRAATWRFGESANLSPSKQVREEIDAIMRSVSMDVLGVNFERSDCSAKVTLGSDGDESDAETPSHISASPSPASASPVSSASGPSDTRSLGPSQSDFGPSRPDLLSGRILTDGGSTWDETAGVVPEFLGDPSEIEGVEEREVEKERCGGEMIPMMYAPQYFEDSDLADEMPERVATLREDYKIWQDGGGPPPD